MFKDVAAWFSQYNWDSLGLIAFVVVVYFLDRFALKKTGKGIFERLWASLKAMVKPE